MEFLVIYLIILLIIAWYLLRVKEESKYLKNLNTTIIILAAVVGGYYAYDRFVYEVKERKKHPPVFNVDCKLEKIAEEDSCYLVKASMSYENKSDKRIYIFLSTINISGIKIKSLFTPDTIKEAFEPQKGNVYYSRHFLYDADTLLLHSLKIDDDSWYDLNQEATKSYIFKIPYGYDVASLVADVTLANEDKKNIDPTLYKFTNYIGTDGNLFVNVEYSQNGKQLQTMNDSPDRIDSIGYVLRDKYGFSHTYSLSQVYLKEPIKK